ncbi:MAG: hypothetical protein JWL90_2019 [Chthoniobacteraceae bacterium]|nr:hypothetical protein [Chthoniobacteraceae bacterium]
MKLFIVRIFTLLTLFGALAAASERAAIEKLGGIEVFAFGGIGFAGTTSEGEIAFKQIFKSDSAEADLLELLKTGNAQSKCYALVGLRLKNRPAFNEQVKSFTSSKQEVQTCGGCIMMKLPMSSVVAGIERGNYDKQAMAKPKKAP